MNKFEKQIIYNNLKEKILNELNDKNNDLNNIYIDLKRNAAAMALNSDHYIELKKLIINMIKY